jgi:hypothetical protein
MGSACFLNDPHEWFWLPRVAIDFLKEKHNPTRPSRRYAGVRNGHWELLCALEEFGQPDYVRVGVFIASLSEKADDLSQWRAYANDAQGYCIGFNTSALPRTAEKVIYSLERQRYIVQRLIESVIGNPRTPKSLYAAESCVSMMRRMQPLMKHHCYEQEAEWRIVIEEGMIPNYSAGKLSHPSATDIGLRLQGESIVPYFSMALSPESITNITIGPQQPEPEATRYALRLLLARNGFTSADINIASSILPYRGK